MISKLFGGNEVDVSKGNNGDFLHVDMADTFKKGQISNSSKPNTFPTTPLRSVFEDVNQIAEKKNHPNQIDDKLDQSDFFSKLRNNIKNTEINEDIYETGFKNHNLSINRPKFDNKIVASQTKSNHFIEDIEELTL